MVAGVVGGGASVASGGKFESGATAAVFGHLFNDMANDLSNLSGDLSYLRHIPEGYEPGNYPTGQCIIAGYGTAWLEVMSFFGGNVAGSAAFKLATRGLGKSLGSNPFLGKTAEQIDDMFKHRGFDPKGIDPLRGQGTYVNPKTGRGYHIDANHPQPKGPHVGVHRPRGPLRDTFKPRDYPLE